MRRPILLLLWLLSDIALFVGSYAFAYFVRVGWILSSDLPITQFLGIIAIVSPVWLLMLLTTRVFSLTRNQTTLRNLAYIAYACAAGAALVALVYYFVYAQIFSRMILLLGMLVSFAAVWLWHIIFERVQRNILRRSPAAYPTLIIGVTRESKALIALLESKKSPLKPIAILDGTGTKETNICGVPVAGKLNRLEEIIERDGITHLIQCSDIEQSINLLGACRARGITYLLLPSVLGIVERDERIESLEGRSVTAVSPERSGWTWFFQ